MSATPPVAAPGPARWGSLLPAAPDRVPRGLRAMASWHRPLIGFAALMVAWGLVSLVGFLTDPRLLDGAPIWAKPLKFNISLALYTTTLAWMTSMIRGRRLRRVAWWTGTLGVLASLLEIALITTQAVRGTSSHFNVSTPVDTGIYAAMGSGIVFFYGSALVIGGLLLFSSRIADRSLVWALRLGIPIGVAGLSVGFLMLRPTADQLANPAGGHVGSHSVGGDDPSGGLWFVGWNSLHGDLRISHFIGMHALQVLPLIALALARFTGRSMGEGTRVRIVLLAAGSWASVAGLTLWQALRGQSIIHPDATTMTTAGALALVGAIYATTVLRRARRDPAR